MTAKELKERFSMEAHVENGAYLEQHYPHTGSGREKSGLIYYYVAPGEHTEFHVIDCDEYWLYTCGAPLELWMISPEGKLEIRRLGVEDGCMPTLFFPSGVVFASRSSAASEDGTVLSCITVPRFSYESFRLLSKEETVALCPDAAAFFED